MAFNASPSLVIGFIGLLLFIVAVTQYTIWKVVVSRPAAGALSSADGVAGRGAVGIGASSLLLPQRAGWVTALQQLSRSTSRFIVVDAKNGLGNRLRALASAMAVAEATGRSTLLVWVPDLHCNCSVPVSYTHLTLPTICSV